jgi:hypothetical protein
MACRNEDDYNDTEQRALHSDFKLLFNPFDRPGVGYGLLMVQGLATFVWNE